MSNLSIDTKPWQRCKTMPGWGKLSWKLELRRRSTLQLHPSQQSKDPSTHVEGMEDRKVEVCISVENHMKGFFCAIICSNYDKEGHCNRDCKQGAQGVPIFFHCNQMVHIKANYPLLNPTRAIQAQAPATLRITDRRQGGVEAPRADEWAFQLMAEEAREEP